eukprot:CAMPEP_0175832196 /NCGR_PEP_ID=MMETSP0107_2-20121207/14857_1 /TAXON_ID=195067 ORGANISM="Goniomonas pacifica, Strain CCMP1869" /NCGR_SAMPLE_ID=MMETSP0107_2 /ASSEMBLY_ACC=CAM_ASM_000203 /LENGTH=69 /DNA_ID=CAMNT_0017145261 /DNA_START=340 /DNA_END=553 /DNA_ORIENTATION=+
MDEGGRVLGGMVELGLWFRNVQPEFRHLRLLDPGKPGPEQSSHGNVAFRGAKAPAPTVSSFDILVKAAQ